VYEDVVRPWATYDRDLLDFDQIKRVANGSEMGLSRYRAVMP
jgi:hypothetical protein